MHDFNRKEGEAMGIFEEVKKNVTVRQAAEFYGFKPNRSGMMKCIFYKDNTPSMKGDRRYYCFGCGCTGDAVDFTAQLFGLNARDAALKLVNDFGIHYTSRFKNNPVQGNNHSSIRQELKQNKKSDEDYTKCVRAYLDYRSMLLEWKVKYAPKISEETWDERFMEALWQLSSVEYILDILLFGEQWEQEEVVREKRKKVESIERKCNEYVRRK